MKKGIQPAYIIKILFCLLFIFEFTACNDDDRESKYPTTSFSQIQLTEFIQTDAPTITSIQTYTYNSGRLISYTVQQSYTAIEPVEMQFHTTVTYGKHQAVISDEFGTVSTYTLNDNGYAVNCVRKEGGGNMRTYTFSYLTDSSVEKQYLKNITETLEDGKIHASIDIDYNNYSALRITYQVGTFQQVYTATTPSEQEISNISEIPCLFLSELHPISLHTVALYGKLLGEPLENLITQIIPDGNTENNETTTYIYKTDTHGIVTSCKAITNSYGKDYVRTVNYVIK